MTRVTFFLNGDEVAFVEVYPSQFDRFITIMSRLCKYAAHFGYNIQYSYDKKSK